MVNLTYIQNITLNKLKIKKLLLFRPSLLNLENLISKYVVM